MQVIADQAPQLLFDYSGFPAKSYNYKVRTPIAPPSAVLLAVIVTPLD